MPRPEIGLEGLPAAAVEEASWWEAHIVEVVYGLPPDAPPGGTTETRSTARNATSLTAREKAKAAELSAVGRPVPGPARSKHRRQRWEARRLAGLVDHRVAKRMSPTGRVDERVAAAMRQAIEEATNASSRTVGFVIWRTREIPLADAGVDGEVAPSAAGRFIGCSTRWPRGKHTTGSASTRRSLAGRPEGMFSTPSRRRRPGSGCRSTRPRWTCWCCWTTVCFWVELTGDDRCRHPGGAPRRYCGPPTPVGGRQRAAGPRGDTGADATGLGGSVEDGALGAAL